MNYVLKIFFNFGAYINFMRKKSFFIVLISFCFYLTTFSQETALPFITNYPGDITGLMEIWSAEKDNRGIMYFAANGGILEYDGTWWQKILLPDQLLVRALAIDKNGRIYYGASGDFGYLEPDSTGKWQIISLYKQIDTGLLKETPAVWNIHIKNDKVYFNALTSLIIYNSQEKENPFEIIRPPVKFLFSFTIDTNIILNEYSQGLVIVDNDTVKQIPGASFFKNQLIFSLLPYDNKGTWLVALWSKLYLFKPDFTDPSKTVIKPFETQAQYLFDKYSVYSGCKLPHNRFAIGTGTDGIAIIDEKGNLIEYINQDRGLISNAPISLNYFDNNLWVTTYKGISKIELDFPVRMYDGRCGLNDLVINSCLADNSLFAGMASGVFVLDSLNNPDYLHPVKFRQVKTNYYETFALKPYFDSVLNTEFVIIGQSNGLEEYNTKTKKTTLIKDNVNVYSIEQSVLNKDIIFVGSVNNLLILKRNHKKHNWEIDTVSGFNAQIRKIAQYKNDLFLSTFYNGIIVIKNILAEPDYDKINPDFKIKFYKVFGGDTVYKDDFAFYARNKIFVTTFSGVFEYDEQKEDFVRSDYDKYFYGNLNLFYEAKETGDIFTDLGIVHPDGSIDSGFLRRKRVKIQTVFYKSPRWYLSTFSGIVVYNDSAARFFKDTVKFKPLIRYVKLNGDSLVFAGNFSDKNKKVLFTQPENKKFVFTYDNNSVTFGFSAPYFLAEDSVFYIYKLEGFDKNWSAPSHNTIKEYTNLPEGDYVFKVQAINIFGRVSSVNEFAFSVKPPWYRTFWAYMFYFLVFGGFVYLIVKFNSRRLIRAKIRLERIVKERTAEINQQKEELKTQAEYLQKANKEITSQKEEIEKAHKKISESIKYASRIQSAILPKTDILKKYFSDYFILYRPRDVVSGDFYWIKEINDFIIIAAADCTGHGVPGAFVSMLGVAFLNEIVRRKEVQSPADMLEQLRKEIKTSLKQTGKIDDNKDGMDIAIVVINKHTLQMQFAGANNPLFLIRNNELIVFKPTRNPVGIYFREKPFKNQSIELRKNDLLYLFSDGFPDQLGAEKENRRFLLKNFKEVLLSVAKLEMKKQLRKLEEVLNKWKGNTPQTDDILVIGIKL